MAALAAATAGLLTSCSEEEIVKAGAKTGEPINFAATTRIAQTRTVYGELNDKQWPLYWVDGDQVRVHCPQANVQDGHENIATYKVEGVDGTKNVYSITGEGLYWGQDDTHYFYEAYPVKNVTSIENGVLTATMPETQTPTLTNGYYVDMDAALMAGMTSCKKSTVASTGVDLPFAPIFTAVDITISASSNQDFELYSISVSSVAEEIDGDKVQQPISGSFTYDYSGGYETLTGNNFVQMEFDDPIPLAKGSVQPIKATIFIRGDYDGAVRVMLNGKLDGAFTQLAKEGDPTVETHLLKPTMRNHITLGALPEKREDTPPVGDLTGSNWIAYEKNATYVSKMSIPGSYDSGNFVEKTGGSDRTQTKGFDEVREKWMEEKHPGVNWDRITDRQKENYLAEIPGAWIVNFQLNHGVRAFDMRLKWDNSAAHRGFYTNKHDNDASGGATLLRTFLSDAVNWLKSHTTEFLVVFLSHDSDASNFNAHINDEISSIMAGNENYYLTNFNSDITVAQARGKVLFVFVNKTDRYIGNAINSWGKDVDGMQQSSFSSFTANTAHKAVIHDDFVCNTVAKKKSQLTDAFNACKTDNDGSNWHITCSCYHTSSANNISDRMRDINEYVIDEVAKCQPGQSLGIVLMGYVCTSDAYQKGQAAVNAVWNLNFK